MKCVYGASVGKRCENDAADMSLYCGGHGGFFSAYLIQLAPGHPDRDRLKTEREADQKAARKAKRAKEPS